MASSPYVFDADEANFQTAVVDKSHQTVVVLDFWAPWCAPCRTLAPILEQLVHARGGAVLLAKVNVDENPELASYFRVEGIPAVKAIRNGELVMQFEGVLPEEQLNDFLDRIGPSESEREITRAAGLEQSAPAEAEAIYAKTLEKEPGHVAARLGLARLRLAAGKTEEIEKLLELVPAGGAEGAEAERIRAAAAMRGLSGDEAELRRRVEADPENAAARCELGQALAAKGDHPAALEMLYSAAERDRALAQGKVKELMVKLFHIVGVRSDLAEEYRDKLQRVMY